MKRSIYALPIIALFLMAACGSDCPTTVYVDDIAPLPPVGIISYSLDNAVELQWIDNQEPDLHGYNVFVSDRYDGQYSFLGTTRSTTFVDNGATNGLTSYYAVTAFYVTGNERDLSRDVVYDTPRPEGLGVVIFDRFFDPSRAGYDFSTYSIVHYNTNNTDFFFEIDTRGVPYLVVWDDTDIQDMGYTEVLDDISVAPPDGWNPTGDALAVQNHTYVIRTFDNHYAKVRLIDITPNALIFDWAYQTAQGNPELLLGGRSGLSKRARGSLNRRNR